MQTSPARIAFYKRPHPRTFQEIRPYEEMLKDFVRETAVSLKKTLHQAVETLERGGLIYPLEVAYLNLQLDVWETL